MRKNMHAKNRMTSRRTGNAVDARLRTTIAASSGGSRPVKLPWTSDPLEPLAGGSGPVPSGAPAPPPRGTSSLSSGHHHHHQASVVVGGGGGGGSNHATSTTNSNSTKHANMHRLKHTNSLRLLILFSTVSLARLQRSFDVVFMCPGPIFPESDALMY
uniref:Uncharacterized protein n=1 Tax=Anopheles farauti TaxID=69004 RepID=A0A182QAW6_9DIPT